MNYVKCLQKRCHVQTGIESEVFQLPHNIREQVSQLTPLSPSGIIYTENVNKSIPFMAYATLPWFRELRRRVGPTETRRNGNKKSIALDLAQLN
ncbi:hypothetical protein OUZ56_011528 [Daphnia magna]|uniref:Uncharacterized protein n=1 Tax=Daphnia magna TaxID=35525 RepID=A0ABQ9Z0D2_9CRUS|nr:hypothetical protein OUZ56_011528 [Daphnia magna]